ncbi:MAG: hypothetical protein FWH36_05955, partial [Lentimicrobiaceae bacterium]|nr:hypothetical protein [Lentimicrobiaceae bacterium]
MRVVKISLLGLALMASATGFSQDILWETNFGGNNNDYYYSVTEVSDGIVAVGHSTTSSFGSGNLVGLTGRGGLDAIIVKYDNSGNVVWKKNFGGNNNDYYYSVTEVSDGIVAVGHSYPGSFENGDLAGIAGKGNDDAIIVKYDNAGNVVWKKNFGGNANDYFRYVTTVSDGIVVVGHSYAGSFGNGDLAGFTWKGDADAIIVKYDNSGNIVWTSHFGGSGVNIFNAVTAVSDGIVAGGYASV